jgi:general secretion pathway protein G
MDLEEPRVTLCVSRPVTARPGGPKRGFTLVELLIVIAIVAILAVIAVPMYLKKIEQARITRTIHEVRDLCTAICAVEASTGAYPVSLAALNQANTLDPWGNPYQYLIVAGAAIGDLRKDQFLVPLNTDFDLYSMGPDGASQKPLPPPVSQDDIIRANDGHFVGIAVEY